jgi:hypothetical protein
MHRWLLHAVSRKEETRPSRSPPSPTARSTGTDGEQGPPRVPTGERAGAGEGEGAGTSLRQRGQRRGGRQGTRLDLSLGGALPRSGTSAAHARRRHRARRRWSCGARGRAHLSPSSRPLSVVAVLHLTGVARRPEAGSGGDRKRSAGGGEEEGPHVEEVAPCSARLRRPSSTTWWRPLALLLPRSAGFGRRRISRRRRRGSCSMLPATERVCGWPSSHRRREGRTGSLCRRCPVPASKGERHCGERCGGVL